MKKKLIVLSGFALGFSPLVVFAQGDQSPTCATIGGGGGTIPNIICRAGGLLNVVIPVVVVLGIVYFVWGVISYVIGDDEEAKKKGRDRMIYGIIGLAVIVAVWGLVNILLSTFGINQTTSVTLPTL